MLLLSLALTLPFLTAPQQDKAQISCGPGASKPVFSQTGENGFYRCDEGAIVIYEDMRFEADWIEFDPATNQLTAGDRVHFVRGGEDVRGSHLSFNLETKTGTLADASGQIEGWYLKADNYVRRADGKWELDEARGDSLSRRLPLLALHLEGCHRRPREKCFRSRHRLPVSKCSSLLLAHGSACQPTRKSVLRDS